MLRLRLKPDEEFIVGTRLGKGTQVQLTLFSAIHKGAKTPAGISPPLSQSYLRLNAELARHAYVVNFAEKDIWLASLPLPRIKIKTGR